MASRRSRPCLADALASAAGKRRYVRHLFDTIAHRYDLITVVLSFGRDAAWKERLVAIANVTPGARALDLACGTGDIAYGLSRAGADVIGLDVTERMIRLARKKLTRKRAVKFVLGDMMALPFPDASVDLVTAGYGIRNVPELEPALAEIARVLRPGGVFLSLDFNHPQSAPIRAVYLGYLYIVGGALGWALHRDPDTYRYIPATIMRYPGAQAVVSLLRQHGFATAEWRRVLGGLMAIHVARRA